MVVEGLRGGLRSKVYLAFSCTLIPSLFLIWTESQKAAFLLPDTIQTTKPKPTMLPFPAFLPHSSYGPCNTSLQYQLLRSLKQEIPRQISTWATKQFQGHLGYLARSYLQAEINNRKSWGYTDPCKIKEHLLI